MRCQDRSRSVETFDFEPLLSTNARQFLAPLKSMSPLKRLRVLIRLLTLSACVHFSVAQQPGYDPGAAATTIGSFVDIQPLRRIQTTERFVEQLAVDGDDAIVLHPGFVRASKTISIGMLSCCVS